VARAGILRLLVVASALFALWSLARASGLDQLFTQRILRDAMHAAGPSGLLLFVVVFALAELIHVPGFVLIGAAIVAYGRLHGFAVAFVAALVSVSFSFYVVRTLGGTALAQIDRPFVRRLLSQLDRHPVRSIVVLRTFLIVAPPLNYALALSGVRFGHYLLGSALGLISPIALLALLFGSLVE
jgi:uncharacterized membrane protein YdjX (TVP38/TMEM64 family)